MVEVKTQPRRTHTCDTADHVCGVCLCSVKLTCQTERPRVVDGLIPQLPHVHGDGRDGIRPHSIGDADLELVGAGRGVLLDDQETSSLVKDEVTEGKSGHKDTHTS